jgi:hypothetical protein
MRREQRGRSVGLCWSAITVVAELLLLVGDRGEVDLAKSRCELGSDCSDCSDCVGSSQSESESLYN